MHIIPAAGTASRFGGLPKFLLPCNPSGKSLLSLHVEASLMANLGEIRIVVHPSMHAFISELMMAKSSKVEVIKFESNSMTETISHAVNCMPCSDENCVITLPDTFNTGMNSTAFSQELSQMSSMLNSLLLWEMDDSKTGKLGQVSLDSTRKVIQDVVDKDPTCDYPYFWGAISLKSQILRDLDVRTPTISHNLKELIQNGESISAVVSRSEYFDCGNFNDYKRMLDRRND
jgi:UTP-glucose-1-phosphate uridylyltransferase